MKITANRVTMARIVLLPIPAAILVWGDAAWIWAATIFAIFLGATDAVDGYLARRDGPTVLGALLDPVADKLFLAAFLLPITAKHHSPFWAVALIFLRELLITALRSSVELREERLKTSQLGKLKTVLQMGGLAVYVIVVFTPEPYPKVLNIAGVLGLCVVAVIYLVRGKKPPFWVTSTVPLWAGFIALTFFLPPLQLAYWLFVALVVVTWVSGADYLLGAVRVFRKTGIRGNDVVKAFWAFANALMLPLVYWHPQALLPVMIALGAHLALGGIDNIVTAEKKQSLPNAAFLVPSLLSVGALSTTFLFPTSWPVVVAASSAAALAGVVAALVAFFQHTELFFPQLTEKTEKTVEPENAAKADGPETAGSDEKPAEPAEPGQPERPEEGARHA